jgi:hypothetical protein
VPSIFRPRRSCLSILIVIIQICMWTISSSQLWTRARAKWFWERTLILRVWKNTEQPISHRWEIETRLKCG